MSLFDCCESDPQKKAAKTQSRQVERQLRQAFDEDKKVKKLLLLGTGGSGKSTIFKQMKIIHQKGYTEEELKANRDVIYRNILQNIRLLVEHMSDLEVAFEDESLAVQYFMETVTDEVIIRNPESAVTTENFNVIKSVWEDNSIQAVWDKRHRFQIEECLKYFMDNFDRIFNLDYIPTVQDVLQSRVKTVGIVEKNFTIEDVKFLMVDVGGQRNERRKWIHAFDNVTAIIYVVSIAEYDQILEEDNTMNRMTESVTLFDEIANSRYFRNTPIIIFFNKSDLYREKIKHVDLKVCFPEYTGGCNYENGIKFITNKFLEMNKNKKNRTFYHHVTCATDTGNIKKVFDAVKNIFLRKYAETVNIV